ncbi:hypothetical protein ElyMa_000751200 [Elysia marginata]|uniref:Uncharacterized protein n=1 Tax=Elysia marginata TaxID=1093978 RepID=A0AAV4GPC3_9GAST|nr:hypothetical protein ElyMa_000751200 [Elysia marginata]
MSATCLVWIILTSLFSFFPMRRKSQKWGKKPFFHLLTLVSMTNLAAEVKDLTISLVNKETAYDAERDNVNLPLARVRERHFSAHQQRMVENPEDNVTSVMTKQKRLACQPEKGKTKGNFLNSGALCVKLDFALTVLKYTTPK